MAIAIGLPAFVLNKALQPGFYAREDTVTPFKYSVATIILDIIVCLSLFWYLSRWQIGFVGIALGTAIAAWINCALLYAKLRKLGHLKLDQRLKRNLPRMILANVVMAGALVGGQYLLGDHLLGGEIERTTALAALIGIAALVYLAIILATGAYTLTDFKRNALRR
jgi:putative peptidoglycan lipid II flippase